jgi:hypothetical protein
MTDWTAAGSALPLACWFGFLSLLLYLHAFSATAPLGQGGTGSGTIL